MSSIKKRLRHPYHLKKLYAHWRLRLLRAAHTGKRAHHQHTSYPMIAMLLLIAGLIMAPASGIAMADTLTVSAVVYGEPPTVSATIDDPTNERVLTTAPITVRGSCTADTYVQLFRNNYPSGTSLCDGQNKYAIRTDLFEGANELVAHIYNFADQEGPISNPVTVTYAPATNVTPIQGSAGTPSTDSGSNPNGPTTPTTPFVLKNDFRFRGYSVGSPSTWQAQIVGGTAPYSVVVDWGDGQTANFVSKTPDTLTFTHTYDKVGPNNGSYDILITATDSAGNNASLQVSALVTSLGPATGSAGTDKGSGAGTPSKIFGIDTKQFVAYSWSSFGGVAIATTGFWLGELRQLRLIRLHFRLTKL